MMFIPPPPYPPHGERNAGFALMLVVAALSGLVALLAILGA